MIRMWWANGQVSLYGSGNHHVNGSHKRDSVHGKVEPGKAGQKKVGIKVLKGQAEAFHDGEDDVQAVENVDA